MLCLAVLVFCVTLTPALYHFNAVRVCERSALARGRYLYSSQIYISDLKWGREGGAKDRWGWAWKGQRSVFTGPRPCLISHDTFVKQCVTPPPDMQAVWASMPKGPSSAVGFPPELTDLLFINQKKRTKFDLLHIFQMWWHEKPQRVMCSLFSPRPACLQPTPTPPWVQCLSEALGLTGGRQGGERNGVGFQLCP